MTQLVYRNDMTKLLADIRKCMNDTKVKRVTIEADDGTLVFNGFLSRCHISTVSEKIPNQDVVPNGHIGFEVMMEFTGTGEPELIKQNPRPSASED